MFCKKCGSQIDEDSVFCSKCGSSISNDFAKEQSVVSDSSFSVVAKKKKYKKILIPSAAILLVVSLLVIAYATSFFGLVPALHAKAPVALAFKSLNSTKDLSSAEFELYVKGDGSKHSASGYFVLGKDLKNSSFDIRMTVNDKSGRAVYSQGNGGSLEESHYEYLSKVDTLKGFLSHGPILYTPEDHEEELERLIPNISDAENTIEKEKYQREIDKWKSYIFTANDFVQNNAINIDLIKKIFQTQMEYQGLVLSDEAKKEAEKLISDFAFKECEKEVVYSKFIDGFHKSKNGSLNAYSFTLDAPELAVTFLEYLRNSLNDFPELKKAFDDYIQSVKVWGDRMTPARNSLEDYIISANPNDFLNTKELIDYTIRKINENNSDYIPDINSIKISMELGKNNILHSFEMSVYDNYNKINSLIKLQIKNHNKIKPDLDSINLFLDKAKETVEMRAMYNEYLKSKVEKINAQPNQTNCKITSRKLFNFDDDGVFDFYYKIKYEQEEVGITCEEEGLCTILDGKVVELFAEGEGGIVAYNKNSYISTAYSNELSKHVICVGGVNYGGATELFQNYYSMENGKLTPLDKISFVEEPYGLNYVKLNGKEVDEKTFFKAADKYTTPTNLDYIFTEYSWKPLRDMMEENGIPFDSITTSNASDTNATTMNIDDYVGGWNINGQDYNSEGDYYETDLDITKLNDSQFSFVLSTFSREGFMNCEAKLNGNRADFNYDDGVNVVIGTLTFSKNSITVKITSSDMVYIPVGTMTFDSRHSHEGNRGGDD